MWKYVYLGFKNINTMWSLMNLKVKISNLALINSIQFSGLTLVTLKWYGKNLLNLKIPFRGVPLNFFFFFCRDGFLSVRDFNKKPLFISLPMISEYRNFSYKFFSLKLQVGYSSVYRKKMKIWHSGSLLGNMISLGTQSRKQITKCTATCRCIRSL